MPRQLRSLHQHGFHHVMNRGVNRDITFFGDADRVEFGRLLGVSCDRAGVKILAYCLMPNHYHLLVHCPDGELSTFMQYLGSMYTRHANARMGRDGPLFRGRFHSIPVETDGYLVRAVRYIHRNPLDLASVDSVDRYRWSSHRTFVGMRQQPWWLETERLLGMFGDDRAAFHHHVARDETHREMTVAPITRLLAAIDLVTDELAERVDRAPQGLERSVALLVFDLLPDEQHASLAAELELDGHRSLRDARARARRQAAVHPALVTIAARAVDLAA